MAEVARGGIVSEISDAGRWLSFIDYGRTIEVLFSRQSPRRKKRAIPYENCKCPASSFSKRQIPFPFSNCYLFRFSPPRNLPQISCYRLVLGHFSRKDSNKSPFAQLVATKQVREQIHTANSIKWPTNGTFFHHFYCTQLH